MTQNTAIHAPSTAKQANTIAAIIPGSSIFCPCLFSFESSVDFLCGLSGEGGDRGVGGVIAIWFVGVMIEVLLAILLVILLGNAVVSGTIAASIFIFLY